jgi:membrane protein implicated in regulation of membrane protease activity
MRTCRVCAVDVPAGEFCGNCGATESPRRGDGPFRLLAHAAAPNQRVMSPRLTSTLFPALPRRSRTTFGIALVGVVALMLGSAVPLWQAALIGLVGLGLPVLFVAYLAQTRALGDPSLGTVVVAVIVGVALGVGWALATDAAAAGVEDDALGLPVSTTKILVVGLAIPLGFLACFLAPTVLMRFVARSAVRNPLGGFAFGAFTALCFVGAGTLTRLAPQLAEGPVDGDGRSPAHLVIAGAIQGLAIPLTAAAVGGAVGATLWFTRRTDVGRPARWYGPTSPIPILVFAVAIYLGLGLLDFFSLPTYVEMIVYALVAVLALYVLRIVVHATLLHQSPGDVRPDETVACPQCDHVVPELPFCPSCGVATHAPTHTASAAQRVTPALSSVVVVIAVAVLVMVGSTALSAWLTPPKALIVCPPDCGSPPISKPVATNPRFTPTTGEFSVSYPGKATAYVASFEPNGVVLDLRAGDGGTLRLFGQPANGQTPREIANGLLKARYPDATFAYQIPNAFVGYELGYGEVADDYSADAIGDDGRDRVLIMVAVKNDFALVAAAAGPYREYGPDFGSGHPSGANFFLALDMAKYVNSFRWRGDPPR